MRTGYRNNRFVDQEVRYLDGDREIIVRYADLGGDRFRVTTIEPGEEATLAHLSRVRVDGAVVSFEDDEGHRRSVRVIGDELRWFTHVDGRTIALDEVPRFPDRGAASAADGAFAPMPGKIVRVLVSVGQEVTTGQTLVIMEAMKMEHSLGAPHDGIVSELRVAEGQQVVEGHVVAVVHKAGEAAQPPG
jgi:biotin carboxyl carrier protein